MDSQLTIYLEAPQEKNLAKNQRRVMRAISERIARAGFSIQPQSGDADRIEERYQSLRHSHGVLIVAFQQWEARRLYRDRDSSAIFTSEFMHISGVMAVAAKKPLLVLREKPVAERGVLRRAFVHPVLDMPESVDEGWLQRGEFEAAFSKWLQEVKRHKHVFLGYSSQAASVADSVERFLTEKLGLTVYDWRDFHPGETIWESIENAERLTNCGVFLFMADDDLRSGETRQGAPRDNVVYEAGYYVERKAESTRW